jgi:hypothetical protein
VQAICDLCSRARRPQGDKFADFLSAPSGHGGPPRSGHPAPGAITADSCGTILAIASFPRRRRVSKVQLNRVTLRVRLPRASTPTHPILEIHWPRSTDFVSDGFLALIVTALVLLCSSWLVLAFS